MSGSDAVDARTAGVGAAAGVTAFLLGYLVTYLLHRDAVARRLRGVNVAFELFGSDPIPTARAVGWLFYNAHFVDTRLPAVGGEVAVNLVLEGEAASLTALLLVPPLLLVLAGLVVGTVAGADSWSDGATVGALAVVGYLPMAIAGTLAVTHAVRTGTVAPDVVTAVLLAGGVYPVAFGGIGGALAPALRRRL